MQRNIETKTYKISPKAYRSPRGKGAPFDISITDMSISSPGTQKQTTLISPRSVNSFDMDLFSEISPDKANDSKKKIKNLEKNIENQRLAHLREKKIMQDYNELLKFRLSQSRQDTLEFDDDDIGKSELEKVKKELGYREGQILRFEKVLQEKDREIAYLVGKSTEENNENSVVKAKDDQLVKLRLENISLIEEIAGKNNETLYLEKELKKKEEDREVFSNKTLANELKKLVLMKSNGLESDFFKILDKIERIDARLEVNSKGLRFLQGVVLTDSCKSKVLEKELQEKCENFVKTINSRNDIIENKIVEICMLEKKVKQGEIDRDVLAFEMQKEIDRKNMEVSELKAKLNAENRKNEEKILNLENKLVKTQETLEKVHSQSGKDLLKMGNEIEALANERNLKIKEKNDDIAVCELQISEMQEKNEKLVKEIGENEKFIENMQETISEYYEKVSKLENKLLRYKEKFGKVRGINIDLEKEVATQGVQLEIQCEEMEKFAKKVKRLEKVIEDKERELEKRSGVLKNMENSMVALEKQLCEGFEKRIIEKNEEIRSLEGKIEIMQLEKSEEIIEINKEHEVKFEKIQNYIEELQTMQKKDLSEVTNENMSIKNYAEGLEIMENELKAIEKLLLLINSNVQNITLEDFKADNLELTENYSFFNSNSTLIRIKQELHKNFQFISTSLLESVKNKEEVQRNNSEIKQKALEIQKKNSEIQQKELEIKTKDSEIQQKNSEILKKESEIQQKNSEIELKEIEIQKVCSEIQQKDLEIKQKNSEIQQKDLKIQKANSEILQIDQRISEIQEKSSEIKKKDSELKQKDLEIQKLNSELKKKDSEIQNKDSKLTKLHQENLNFSNIIESTKKHNSEKASKSESEIKNLTIQNQNLATSTSKAEKKVEDLQKTLKFLSQNWAETEKALQQELQTAKDQIKNDQTSALLSKISEIESKLVESSEKELNLRKELEILTKNHEIEIESLQKPDESELIQLKQDLLDSEIKMLGYEKQFALDQNLIKKLKENNLQRQNTLTIKSLESKLDEKDAEIEDIYKENEKFRKDLEGYKEVQIAFKTVFEKITENENMLSSLVNLNVNSYEGRQTLKGIIEKSELHISELQGLKLLISEVFKSLR